jgi:hypothetical protein
MRRMSQLNAIVTALSDKSTAELIAIAKRIPKPKHGPRIHWQTLYKIRQGITTNPRLDTVEAINKALSR